jgi:hypothetical protein
MMARCREPLTKQDLPWIILVLFWMVITIGNEFSGRLLSSQEVGCISAFCMFVAALWIAVRQFGIRLGHTTAKEIGGLLALTLFFFALVMLAFVFGWCGEMTLIEFLLMQKLPSAVCYPELISSYGLGMLVIALLLCNAVAVLYFAIVRVR